MASLPPRDHHAGADTDLGRDREVVDQTPAARKADAQSLAGRPSVGERLVDIGDSRSAVLEPEAQSAARTVVEHFPPHLTATAIDEGVARQLAGRSDHLGLVDE